MADGLFGGFDGMFDNATVLWFIILFLLLFWCWGGLGAGFGYKEQA